MKFRIKAGKHRANNWLRRRICLGNSINFRFRFIEGQHYDYSNIVNGWSKIVGLASPFVHEDSCRIVWQCNPKGLRAGIYVYSNGISPQEDGSLKRDIGCIAGNTWYNVTITRTPDEWVVLFSEDDMPVKRYVIQVFERSRLSFPLHLVCHPWVGGRFTLDHDVVLEVRKPVVNSIL